MKKISLSLLLFSSLLLSDELFDVKMKQITDTKAQIKALQESLVELEASLPPQIEKIKEKDREIKTHAEFGYVNNKGNTNTQSLTLDANIKKTWNKHSLSFAVDGEYASDDGEDTKNKYLLELEYDYKLSNRLFFSYLVGYKYDEFSGYDYRTYTGPGLKYITIDTKNHNLILENSILYAKDKTKETNEIDEYASYRAKGVYTWQMLENLKFEETLTYSTDISEVSKFFVFSKTAFISKLSDIFSVSLSYKIDYVNQPEDDKVHSDRTLSANLIADF